MHYATIVVKELHVMYVSSSQVATFGHTLKVLYSILLTGKWVVVWRMPVPSFPHILDTVYSYPMTLNIREPPWPIGYGSRLLRGGLGFAPRPDHGIFHLWLSTKSKPTVNRLHRLEALQCVQKKVTTHKNYYVCLPVHPCLFTKCFVFDRNTQSSISVLF